MEHVNETAILSIHKDNKTQIPKYLRDQYNMKPGDRLTVIIQGITRKIHEPLVAARVEGQLKPEEKPSKLYEKEADKVQPIGAEPPAEAPAEAEKPTVELSKAQAEKLGIINEGG